MVTSEEIELVLQSGTAARRAGRFAVALQLMNNAAAMCGDDQRMNRAHVLRELGELARNTHDLPAAQTHYEQAVALLRTLKDPPKLAHTIRHLGDVHAGRGHWPEAGRCFTEALDIYRTHPSTGALDRANAIRSYALLKTRIDRRGEARNLWIEACALYQSAGIAAGVEECRRRADQLA